MSAGRYVRGSRPRFGRQAGEEPKDITDAHLVRIRGKAKIGCGLP